MLAKSVYVCICLIFNRTNFFGETIILDKRVKWSNLQNPKLGFDLNYVLQLNLQTAYLNQFPLNIVLLRFVFRKTGSSLALRHT